MISVSDIDAFNTVKIEHENENGPYAKSFFIVHDSIAEVHNEILRWGKDVWTDILCDMGDFLELLKSYGITNVFVYSASPTETMKKYWKHIGFTNIVDIIYDNKKLMYSSMEIM